MLDAKFSNFLHSFQGLLVPLTALICQTTLISKVLCVYPTKESNKVNCDEPFQFCSNKRPSSQPGSCSRNGGYPADLTYDNTAYADYSQYRAALALKPCFNKEMADMGFDSAEDFKTIDVFTENNIRREAAVNVGQLSSDVQFSTISIIYEEPGSRKALIDYLK